MPSYEKLRPAGRNVRFYYITHKLCVNKSETPAPEGASESL